MNDTFGNISPELQEKAKACKTPEELLSLAKKEGIELSNEQLEAISGGGWLNCDDEYDCKDDEPLVPFRP